MKKSSAEEQQDTVEAAPQKTKKDYFEVKLPKISFRNTPINVYLVIALVIFAFILGMLTNKLVYMEQMVKTQATQTAQAANNANTVAAAAATPMVQPTPPPFKLGDNGHFPALGDDKAKVTVVEFADFRCPFCEQFFTQVESQLKKDYIDTGKVKFYFRSYAFLGPASTLASNAAECANDQDKFWAMHDYFYQNQPQETDTTMYTVDNLTQIAGTLGMDTTQFQSCLSANQENAKLTDDMTSAGKYGVDGTPTFFVNGTRLVGALPYSDFQKAIDDELKK